jgi:hypothetical protein
VAQPRGFVIDRNPPQLFSPWGRWSPWYGYGYGPSSYYGHVVYSPWLYGGSVWSWNRYGWHDPFLFDPFGYGGYAPYYWPSERTDDDNRGDGLVTGSLRLRVNPGEARVYIDGALAGVASEFGGLSGHLALPAGEHEIELRADGYATYTGRVEVRPNRTQTERINLDRQ